MDGNLAENWFPLMTETHNTVCFCHSVFGGVCMCMFIMPVYGKEAGKQRCAAVL